MSYQEIEFSKEELARYNRHIIIPEFGEDAQIVGGNGWHGESLLCGILTSFRSDAKRRTRLRINSAAAAGATATPSSAGRS